MGEGTTYQRCSGEEIYSYPPGNYHIPQKWHFEDDFPFPKVGYVNSLEGTLPETNKSLPENRSSQKEAGSPLQQIHFQRQMCQFQGG